MTRHLVDDGAFAALPSCPDLATALRDFHDILYALQREGQPAGMTRGWAYVPVGRSSLGEHLLTVDPTAHDAAQLTMIALDQCTVWDDDPDLVVDPSVQVDGAPYESFAVARCAELAERDSLVVACVTVGGAIGAGVRRAGPVGGAGTDVCFLVTVADRPILARHRIRVEVRNDHEFFALAAQAFPELCFADGVTFRKFEGAFPALKDQVARHLAALNDHFSAAFDHGRGDLRVVCARLGVEVSNEGETRASERLMALRDAVLDGRTYRCEMHTKIERHRNRIHFHRGDDHSGGRIVVGHFVMHFTT